MSDDTERRLRDALRDANLPAAPAALRSTLLEVVASTPTSPTRRPWLRMLLPTAAVIVLAVIVVGLGVGIGRPGPAVSPGATSDALYPTVVPVVGSANPVSPPPDSFVGVYESADLESALATDRASLVGHVVLVHAAVDARAVPTCALGSAACLIGTLAGTPEKVVASRYTQQLLADVDLTAVSTMALKVRDDGLEYLGWLAGGRSQGVGATLEDLRASAAHPPAGPVTFVVRAWLVATPPLRCPFTDLPVLLEDTPFAGCEKAWLTPGEEQPTTTGDNSLSVTPPSDGIAVQWSAYREYAPNPATVGMPTPRLASYFVRLVTDTRPGRGNARGWQVVGRVDDAGATASPSSPPSAGARVYSAAELEAALATDRAQMVAKVVLVSGTIPDVTPGNCIADAAAPPAPDNCDWGTLAGTPEPVRATRYTAQILGPVGPSISGVMAVRVLENGLEYLGVMSSANGPDFRATMSDLAATAAHPPSGSVGFVVNAWLGTSGPLSCPSGPSSPPPPDTPFGSGCPSSWLASTDSAQPADAVPVQWTAYQDFATGNPGLSGPPRFGTYLVRLVVDTRQGPDGPRGWQVVARLAP